MLIDSKAEVSSNTRRWYGLSLGAVIILLALALSNSPWLFSVIAAAGILLTLVYYLFPATQLAIIGLWRKVTWPLAWLMGHLLLMTVFFAVVFPIGIMLRVFGHAPLDLEFKTRRSAWIDRRGSRPKSSYFKQY